MVESLTEEIVSAGIGRHETVVASRLETLGVTKMVVFLGSYLTLVTGCQPHCDKSIELPTTCCLLSPRVPDGIVYIFVLFFAGVE